MAPLKVVFICQAVDEDDPVLASTLAWISAMWRSVDCLSVLTLRIGNHRLPAEVPVQSIKRSWRPATAFQLYWQALRLLRKKRLNCFFIYQGGPYPVLLSPFKMLGVKMCQWKAHPAPNWVTFLGAHLSVDRIFTSVPSAFPYRLRHVRTVGQGIDTELFLPRRGQRTRDLVTVARISPVKRIEQMVLALHECLRSCGATWILDIYGTALNQRYRDKLDALIRELGLIEQVRFKGAVPHRRLPGILNRYRLFLNFSGTALDRSVVEAMSCGLPILSSNPCVAEILPLDLRRCLIVDACDSGQQAERIQALLSDSGKLRTEIGARLRQIAQQNHSLERLMTRILTEMRGLA